MKVYSTLEGWAPKGTPTVVSVDGIGAFDLISKNSMMRGLRHMVGSEKSALSTANRHPIGGRTTLEMSTPSSRERTGSRAIH